MDGATVGDGDVAVGIISVFSEVGAGDRGMLVVMIFVFTTGGVSVTSVVPQDTMSKDTRRIRKCFIKPISHCRRKESNLLVN